MTSPANHETLFTFQLNQDGMPGFEVVRFEGHEAISRPFRFDLTLVSPEVDIDLDAVLKAPATFRLRSRDGSRSVPYHGMLAEIEQTGLVDGYAFYRAVLVPRLWRLGLNHLTDVYLDERTIPEVISAILQRNGLQGPDFRLQLKDPGVYRQRSFVCQYQESDLDFVSRWMESEGLYYFFDHGGADATGDVLVITDHRQGQPAEGPALRYTPPENVQTDRQDSCATAFHCRITHVPGKVLVQDFNYRKASLGDNLKAEQAVDGGGGGRFMFYGGNLRQEADAERLARVRSEEQACRQTVFRGEAPAIGLRAGYPLAISHHFRAALDASYLVTEVRHEGSQTGVVLAGQNTGYQEGEHGSRYHCSFSALPGTAQFRAPRETPWPRICGYLSAIIDGEGSGELAELNEYGQYKVQLLYDYSAKSENKGSSWLRMATPYAGKQEGMHFPLLKGAEVIIGFNDGDPDQPVILGAVPNSLNPSIVQNVNSACNAIRTTKGNILNMVDRPGKVGISMYSPVANTVIYMGSFPITGADATPGPQPADSDPVNTIANL